MAMEHSGCQNCRKLEVNSFERKVQRRRVLVGCRFYGPWPFLSVGLMSRTNPKSCYRITYTQWSFRLFSKERDLCFGGISVGHPALNIGKPCWEIPTRSGFLGEKLPPCQTTHKEKWTRGRMTHNTRQGTIHVQLSRVNSASHFPALPKDCTEQGL